MSTTFLDLSLHHSNLLLKNQRFVKALEKLLGNDVKAPIHSLVVFTNAKEVKTDSDQVLMG